ncbi:MAG: ABC transporter transmembrane domain-containing protein, partial [Chloroflexota bacterium]
LDGGQVVEQGTHTQLLQKHGLYARMYHREEAITDKHNIIDDDLLAEVLVSDAGGGKEPPPDAIHSKPKRVAHDKKVKEEDDEIVGLDYQGGRLTRLLRYVWRYWQLVLLALPMIVGASLQDLVGPLLSKTAIDQFITSGRLDGLWLILVLFLIVAFASFIFRYLRSYLMQKVGQSVVRDLRVQLFGHLLHNSLSFFDRYPSGSLIGRLTSDMDAINDLLSMGAISVASDIVTLAAIIIMMLLLDWRLALVSLAVLPILFLASLYFRKVLRKAWRSSRRKYSILVGYLAENYTGMLTVQLFNRQATHYARFQELNEDYYKSNRFIVTAHGLFLPFVTFLSSFANALLLLVGSLLFVNDQTITLGLLVAFLQYTERAFQPLRDIAERYTLFQAASTSSERIFGLLDKSSEVQDPPQPRLLVSSGQTHWDEVRFEQVRFGYDPAFPVLKDVSFTIQAGEKIAIVGATGAGKTSIISLLGRHYDLQQGRITIGGTDIREVSQKDLRQHLALVLQDPILFKGTIAENIGLGRSDVSEEEMQQAARCVGADTFIAQLPGGYNYELQERGSNISAGQRQLLSFARAIAYNPDAILILDEATSSVDTESEAIIQEALKKLLENRTALIIAHRLSTIRDVDRVMVIDQGRIVEFGTQAELIARRGFYYQLYTHQLSLTGQIL